MADLLRLAGPLAAGYAVHHAIYFVDRAMATTAGPGSVATLNYAYRLALVVGQLSGLAVSTAVFPRMAEDAARNDLGGLRGSLWAALRFVWAVGLPACGALIVLRQPLVELLFERGAFDPAATAAVSGVLPWYAVAVLADALCQPLWRVVYARRRAGTVVAVNALQTGVRIGCNLALLPALGYNGLALSAAAGLTLQAAVLAVLARRSLGAYLPMGWPRPVLEVTAATAAALAATAWVTGRLEGAPAWAALAAGGAACGLAYAGVRRLLSPSPRGRGPA